MSTFIWCEIVCACCSKSTAGEYTSGRVRRRQMKAEARKNGFVFDGKEAFCGSECADRWNAMHAQEPRP